MPGLQEVNAIQVGRTPKVLLDAATITGLDASENDMFKVTLGGNRTVALPTNGRIGQVIRIFVIQDNSGSRTLTWTGWFKPATFTLTSTGNHMDIVTAFYDGTNWNLSLTLDVAVV